MTTVHIVTVAGREWLNANDRIHWAIRAELTDSWKNLTRLAARAAELPRFDGKVHITAVCLFPDRRRRDPGNWYPTAKACIDGLTDSYVKVKPQLAVRVAGWLADDDAKHLDGPDMRARIEPGTRQPTLELHITECGDEL